MNKHDSSGGGETLCGVDGKGLASLRECLSDGAITPREVGKVLQVLGMRRSDLRAVSFLLVLFAALPVVVAGTLGIAGGDLGLALVVILPAVPFTTLASAVAFFLLRLGFRFWTTGEPARRPRTLVLSSSAAVFAGQMVLSLTSVASPKGDPAWSGVVWLFLLSVWLLTAVGGLLVAWRQALSSRGRGMWIAWPILLLSMIHPTLLIATSAVLWVASRQDHQARVTP
jgi:hypothetical protein